ncbi:hypothetical protein MKW92_052896 [Papaver armeniacum]|nr:hypothetical protein MKW92_052896 [Papaver armeniacum]
MLDSETLEERIQIGSLQLTETSKSEEGEWTGNIGDLGLTEMGSRGDVTVSQASKSKTRNRWAKKKNKNKKTSPVPAERKTYLVWNAKRDPNAYKKIVSKGKEIEAIQTTRAKELNPSLQKAAQPSLNSRAEPSNNIREHVSAMNRIRVPVPYDDLLGEEVEGHE